MSLRLYELTETFLRLQRMAEERETIDPGTGEVVDPDEGMKAVLDTVEMALEGKVENIAKVVRALDATAAILKEEEARIARRRKSAGNSAKWLKLYARDAMLAAQKPKFKTDLFTIYVQTSAPPVIIAEGAEVPEGFLRPPAPREPDKKALQAALKSGREFEGIGFGEATQSLIIR